MVPGKRKSFRHNETDYLIQCEDMGQEAQELDIKVYKGGAIIWSKCIPYPDVLKAKLEQKGLVEAIQQVMEKTLDTVAAAIQRGRIG